MNYSQIPEPSAPPTEFETSIIDVIQVPNTTLTHMKRECVSSVIIIIAMLLIFCILYLFFTTYGDKSY